MLNIILNHERNLSNMLQCYQQSNLIEIQRLQLLSQMYQQNDTSHLVNHILKNKELFLLDKFSNIENPIYNICPISQEEFSHDDDIILLKCCNHLFNKEQFIIWMSQNNLCPYCRTNYLESFSL